MKKVFVLFLAVLMAVTLVACNQSESAPVSDSVVGTYVLTAASQEGTDIPADSFPAGMSVVLNEDHTGTYGPAEGAMNITWSSEGNTVTLISEQIGPDDPFVMDYDGTTLSGTTAGLTMVYTKQ